MLSSRRSAAPRVYLRQTDPDGLWTFAAFGDIHDHTLAFVERADPGPLERRGVDKRVLAALVANDKSKALLGIEPLHCPGFFNSRLGGRRAAARCWVCRPPCRRRPGGAAVDADDLGHLGSLLPRRDPDLERLACLQRSDAVALEHAGVEKSVPRAIRQFNKPEASFGLEPFDDGADRRPRRCFEPRLTEARRSSEFAKLGVITLVVEITAAGLTKIPVSDQVGFLSSRLTVRSGPQNPIVPKNRAGRERINCDNAARLGRTASSLLPGANLNHPGGR